MLTSQNSTVCLRVYFFGCILLFENFYETPDSLGIVMEVLFFFFLNLNFLTVIMDTDSLLYSSLYIFMYTNVQDQV